MMSVLEAAEVSSHVYRNVKDIIVEQHYFSYKKGTSITNGWVTYEDVDPNMTRNKNFFARLYVKFRESRAVDAVMAIRGTDPSKFGNVMQDLRYWFDDASGVSRPDSLPSYLGPAIKFYTKCQQYMRTYFPHLHNVKLTGHSLGGAIAKFICLCRWPVPTVVFNAPGCGNFPHIHRERQSLIHNINSHYGIINKVGFTLGRIDVIDVPQDEQEAKDVFNNFDKEGYEISNELYAMNYKFENPLLRYLSIKMALSSRAESYLSAALKVGNSKCKTEYPAKHFYQLQAYMNQEWCRAKESYNAVNGQHNIDNVISTLMKTKYSGLAHEVF